MKTWTTIRRLALLLGLLAAPVLSTAHAAPKETEEEIQARIDAELDAMIAEEDAKRAAAAAAKPAPAPAVEEAKPGTPAVPARIYKTVPVVLTTTMGEITMAIEVERAPLTAANFLRYVDERRLDGTTFYRAFTFEDFPNIGMVQGGPQNDPRRILKPVAHEPTSVTGLSHDDGAVSLARDKPGSGNADFFIIIGEMHGLDAGSGQTADDLGFAVFGHVTKGMELVRAMTALPRSPTKGEGAMRGQILEEPVKILTARRASEN